MVNPADMAERHARILAELSELGMGFARDASRDAAQAETPEERARAALVFQRVSRSIRQSLALEAKLVRDARREEREQARQDEERRRGQMSERRRRLRDGVEALVWGEAEHMDADEEVAFLDEIEAAVDAELDAETGLADPLAAPLADQVARAIARLGFEVTPEGHVRRTPEPGAGPPAEPAWQGSG